MLPLAISPNVEVWHRSLLCPLTQDEMLCFTTLSLHNFFLVYIKLLVFLYLFSYISGHLNVGIVIGFINQKDDLFLNLGILQLSGK